MPISFYSIPEEIRRSIVGKMEARDFSKFYESSTLAFQSAKNIRTTFFVSIENKMILKPDKEKYVFISFFTGINIEHRIFPDDLIMLPIIIKATEILAEIIITDEVCEVFIEFLALGKMSFKSLSTYQIDCSPESFDRLLEALKITEFESCDVLSSQLLRSPTIKNLHTLTFKSCNMNDEDLLSLRSSKMFLNGTHITSQGINLLLKEWVDKKRCITIVDISSTVRNFQKKIVFDGMFHSVQKSLNYKEEIFEVKRSLAKEKIRIIIRTKIACISIQKVV